jgi:hypothetical protein
MAGNQMSEQMANEIFDLLVAEAGAYENDRSSFVHAQCRDEYRCSEFRFCGCFGFGGKLWVNAGRIYVNCYQEEMNKKKQKVIDLVNAKLAEIKAKYQYSAF